jgi:hypothetical protein
VDGSALQLTLREMRGHLADVRVLAVMAVIGVVLGFAGPFGTFEAMPVAGRIAYWVATVFLTYIFGFGLSTLVDGLWGRGRPLWLRVALMIVPAGLGATVIVGLLNLAVFGPVALGWDAILALLTQCYAVTAAVVVVSLLTEARDAGQRAAPDAPPAILERVPPQQRGGLIALIVEDHYVDIVTERGKTLVLMRLADAIRETGSTPGLQVHRSHWVARAAVVRAHRRDGKVTLELSNGMLLPVSRGYLPAVRDADLL